MKRIINTLLTLFFINCLFGQNVNQSLKYEINFPEKVFSKTPDEIFNLHQIEDGETTIYFMVREISNIPKVVTNSKEFADWYNMDKVDVMPDFFKEQIITISNEKAYFIITKNDYSFEDNIYLKLNEKGYIFSYSISNSKSREEKEKMYIKYYKEYQNFIKNIKITRL